MPGTGWFLGLPYMRGVGLRAVAPGEIAPDAPRDFLFVDDVLSVCADWRESLGEWWPHLAMSAHLILWVKDCTQGEVAGHRFTRDLIDHALDGVEGWEQLECDVVGGHVFAVYRKVAVGQKRVAWCKSAKHLLLIRAGAYGDAVMASSVLPLLKREGWAIDFLTGEAGEEALRLDPHLSRILVVKKNQVEDAALPYFWEAHALRYDRVINLTFSVEGELLKQPWRGDYHWSEEQRRALCGRSYLRRIHELSGVTCDYAPRFYASAEEKSFALHFLLKQGPFILWSLRGSAVHKWWPYTPQAVCRILAHSQARIVLSGGEDSKELAAQVVKAAQDYFGDASRVIDLTGKHTMRKVFSLAQMATLVVGPETGVLNVVSFEKNRKLVFLSHSSPANLTNDWVNARALAPHAPCYPCHRLHYGHEWCPQDEKTGAAACAASLSAGEVAPVVLEEYRKALDQKLFIQENAA
ncbi:MAG: glycosyltransferase family 9 protein [Proteobacteria bacterium]|nr:glycosyltransferase family 9 protein [Pseudomonadota bacterium]